MQWENKGDLKIDVYLHGIRDGTHRWKGNTYLIIQTWIYLCYGSLVELQEYVSVST